MAATKRLDLIGRRQERDAIDRLLDGVRRGESGALVIRGEAGIGKTALIDYVASRAQDCRVVRVEGVESELGVPFSALHQVCAPLLDQLATLPDPQGRALRIVLGVEDGPAPDLFMVGLATLILLSDAGARRPLILLVDDAQWIDEPSRQVLAFVGRRVAAEAVLLIMAVREVAEERLIPGIPDLTVTGLSSEDANTLFDMANPGGVDPRIRTRVVTETGGNPLWLLELSRTTRRSGASGEGVEIAAAGVAAQRLQDLYVDRIRSLPEPTQRLMTLTAAEPTGDATLVWRAAAQSAIGPGAADPATHDELLESATSLRFRHPLVRSATLASVSDDDRRTAHAALAAATDPAVEPALHAWHRAEATTGPDEDVATELERSAGTVQSRAGLAAAASFLERAASLTPDQGRRAERTLVAAEAKMRGGDFASAVGLLAAADAASVDDGQRARAERLRGQIAWISHTAGEAPRVLLEAAARLEPLDVLLARDTYLDSWMAAYVAGHYAQPGGGIADVSAAARATAAPPTAPRPSDLFLDGLAAAVGEGRAAGVPSLRAGLDAFLTDPSILTWLQWGNHSGAVACMLWDATSWQVLSARQVDYARAVGALTPLSITLNGLGLFLAWSGDFDGARAALAEERAIDEVIGIQVFSAAALLLAAYRGRETEDLAEISRVSAEAGALGQGIGVHVATWARAILLNGLGRHADALAATSDTDGWPYLPNLTSWVLVERVEAAIRTGRRDLAVEALRQLSADTEVDGSDWGSGVEARSRALVSDGTEGDRWYREAIDRLDRTPMRTDLARAHLLYGEWLALEDRRLEARDSLRTAYDLFSTMGAEAFAARARRALQATGEQVRSRDVSTGPDLTAQELHIAHLARDGRTNEEIGSVVFLSPRAVDWHLRNVFTKLGVASRAELAHALPASGPYAGAVTGA